MSLNPMTAKPTTLEAFVATATALPHDVKHPSVIAIVGGSASGKTTVAYQLQQALPNATIFSQDLFQFGKDFPDKKTSPYKWDDPANFALDQGAEALAVLKQGQSVTVPAFEVVANQRIGTKEIAPSEYIIWEGVYALGSDAIWQHVDLSLFIDTPFMVRLLRRIARFFDTREVDETTDMSTPARQMLTFVWAAEKSFMPAQLDHADYVIAFSDDAIKAEVQYFIEAMTKNVPPPFRQPHQESEKRSVLWNGLTFVLKESSFEIYLDATCLYVSPIETELRQQVYHTFDEVIA